MDDILTLHDSHAAGPEDAGRIDQAFHQNRMGSQQISNAVRPPRAELFIGQQGVADLLNFPRGSQNALALQYGRNLFFRERVAFYGEGALNGSYAVSAPKPKQAGSFVPQRQTPKGLRNFRDERDDFGVDGEGRLVAVGHISSTFGIRFAVYTNNH